MAWLWSNSEDDQMDNSIHFVIIQIDGRFYTQHIAGGRTRSTFAEVEMWHRLQSEIRQKKTLLAHFEAIKAELIINQQIVRLLDRALADKGKIHDLG
jgi:hypothetical protein